MTTDHRARCIVSHVMCTMHQWEYQLLCIISATEYLWEYRRVRTSTGCTPRTATSLPTMSSTGASTSARSATSPMSEGAHVVVTVFASHANKVLGGWHAEHAIPNPSGSQQDSPQESAMTCAQHSIRDDRSTGMAWDTSIAIAAQGARAGVLVPLDCRQMPRLHNPCKNKSHGTN